MTSRTISGTSGKFHPPQTTPELAAIQEQFWKKASDILGTPFSQISAKPVGEFLAGFITPRTPEEAQAAAVMAVQPGVVEANFRSPAVIQALRKQMAEEMRARGPMGEKQFADLMWHKNPHISASPEALANTPSSNPFYGDYYNIPEVLPYKGTNPTEQILRGSWYHGQSAKSRMVSSAPMYKEGKLVVMPEAPMTEEGYLARVNQTGFPISHHAGQSISSNFGEPSGVSLSLLPTKSKEFAADEYIHRVLPLYGKNPAKATVNLMTPEGRTALNDAYDVSLNRYLSRRVEAPDGEMISSLNQLARDMEFTAGHTGPQDVKEHLGRAIEDYFTELRVNLVAQQEFNQSLSKELQDRGYRAMLYNPGRHNEYEMLMLDPKYALPLDYRKMGEYLPERSKKAAGVLNTAGDVNIAMKNMAATPGARQGLQALESEVAKGHEGHLRHIYRERPWVDRLSGDTKNKIVELVDPDYRAIVKEFFEKKD